MFRCQVVSCRRINNNREMSRGWYGFPRLPAAAPNTLEGCIAFLLVLDLDVHHPVCDNSSSTHGRTTPFVLCPYPNDTVPVMQREVDEGFVGERRGIEKFAKFSRQPKANSETPHKTFVSRCKNTHTSSSETGPHAAKSRGDVAYGSPRGGAALEVCISCATCEAMNIFCWARAKCKSYKIDVLIEMSKKTKIGVNGLRLCTQTDVEGDLCERSNLDSSHRYEAKS